MADADGTQTVYVYDGAQVIAEYSLVSQTLTLKKRFIYGPGIDEPVCMITYAAGSESGRYFYHFDGQGNVIALSNSSGNVVEEYEYDVYGLVSVQSLGQTWDRSQYGNPYLFTGRRWDGDTGLYYYRARMYSPALGRFLQPDPIGYADGMNLYAYVGNNLLNFIDPWGLCKGSGTTDQVQPGPGQRWFTMPNGQRIIVPSNYDPFLQAERSSRIDSLEWYLNVTHGGQWDWKRKGHKDMEITHPEYHELGNFDYGITGAARGMSRGLLHWGARRAGGGEEAEQDTEWINQGYDWYLLNTPDHLLTPWQLLDKRRLIIELLMMDM